MQDNAPLQPILRPLQQARMRLLLRRGLEGGSRVLLVVLGLWVALRLWQVFSRSEPALLGWKALAAVLVLGFSGLAYSLWRRTPSLLQMARLTDQKLGLHERLSTVLELSPDSPHPLHQNLLREAIAIAPQIKPARVVPLTLPQNSRWLLLAALVAAGLYLWAPAEMTSQTAPAKSGPLVSKSLKPLVEKVQQDAERTNDPYLQAEARNLEQLRAQIEQGKLSGKALEQELGSALERLGQSYGLSPAGGAATQDKESSPGKGSGSNAATNPNQSSSSSEASAALQKRVQQLTQALQNQRPGATGQTNAAPKEASRECIFIEGYECLTPDQLAKLQASLGSAGDRIRIQGPRGGTPGGSGDKAGKGAQAKLGAKESLSLKSAAQPVVLPKHPVSSSARRIQISAPTQLAKALQSTQGTAGLWQRGEEAPMHPGLQGLSRESRNVVSQYFAQKDE